MSGHVHRPTPKPRLDTWLIDYCHAPDNAHWRAASRLMLIAIVARVYCPGVKWDQVLTLIGKQGDNKSSLCRVLAIRPEWHLEGFKLSWSMKEIIENTAGKLIWEYGEFAGHRLSDQDSLKDAVTRSSDKARKAYGRYSFERPRQGIIIGNSNKHETLIDQTGNRRYWPLELSEPIDITGLKKARHQLYGEAVHAYRANQKVFNREGILLPEQHWAYFGELQEDARLKTTMEDQINRLVDGINEGHLPVTTMCNVLDVKIHDKYAIGDITATMDRLGWQKVSTRMPGDTNKQRYFVKGARPEAVLVKHVGSGSSETCR